MNVNLRYQVRGRKPVEMALTRALIVIGHGSSCDVVIDAPGVLERHFQLLIHGDAWLVEDLTDGRTHVETGSDVHLVLGRRCLCLNERLFIGFQASPVFEAWLVEAMPVHTSTTLELLAPLTAVPKPVGDVCDDLRDRIDVHKANIEQLRSKLANVEQDSARALSRQAMDYEALLRAERHKRQAIEKSCSNLRGELDTQLAAVKSLRAEVADERHKREQAHQSLLTTMRRANDLTERVRELELVIQDLQRQLGEHY